MQHDLAQARIIKDRGNGYRFRMTLKQYSVFESQKQKSHASLDHLIKTLRGGEGSFFRDQFVKGITRSDKQRYSMRLRSSEKKEWTVTGAGIFKRAEKLSRYTPEEKERYSPYQSMTLVSQNIRPTPFGHRADRRDKLVGVVFSLKPENALLGRLFVYDVGTVNRPYDHDIKADAENYYKKNYSYLSQVII